MLGGRSRIKIIVRLMRKRFTIAPVRLDSSTHWMRLLLVRPCYAHYCVVQRPMISDASIAPSPRRTRNASADVIFHLALD